MHSGHDIGGFPTRGFPRDVGARQGMGGFVKSFPNDHGDPYFNNVVALLHLATGVTDVKGNTWTLGGSAAISAARARFNLGIGGGSLLTAPTTDKLTAPDTTAFGLATNDFTYEGSVFTTATNNNAYLLGQINTVTAIGGAVVFIGNATLYFYCSSNGTAWDIANGIPMGPVLSTGGWYDYAISRNDNEFSGYIDGKTGFRFLSKASIFHPTQAFFIGGQQSTSVIGNSAEIRITNGVGRFTDDYVPLGKPFPDF